MIDLERRSVVDIRDDRSVERAARWLLGHPSVEVVSRGRCGLYAQAVREGAPQARQVADRFHLVQNLRMAIEEQMRPSGRASEEPSFPKKPLSALRHIADAPVSRIGNPARDIRDAPCLTPGGTVLQRDRPTNWLWAPQYNEVDRIQGYARQAASSIEPHITMTL